MVRRSRNHFTILCILLLFTIVSQGQFFDSLQVKTGLETRFSSASYQPFWLMANRHGTVADIRNDLSPYIRITNKHVLAEPEYQNDHGFYDYNEVSLSYGLSIYNNNHFRSTIIEEGYVKLEYKKWAIHAGRFEETNDIDPLLSSGSFGVSTNALPIPKIGIAVTDYTAVPFTNGWLQFKGTFAHGWLGHDRYMKNSYYHEKTFYLRAGAGPLKLYGGIQHFAEWGGNRDDQQADKSLKAFWDVFFIKETNDANTHAGDHRGVLEAGAYWENDAVTLHGYLQKPFEGKQDIGLKNSNGLAGLLLTIKNEDSHLRKLLFEIISTKDINTSIPANQRESYYNNNTYKTGWEYQNNIIGTPLFINRSRANNYFPEIEPFDWNAPDADIPPNANIINNRIFGIHAGALYSFSDPLQGRTLLTWTKNYGNIAKADPFTPFKTQWYFLQEISYRVPNKNIVLSAGLGFDFGELTKTDIGGGRLGIEWTIADH